LATTDSAIAAAVVASSIAALASIATLILTRAGERSSEFRAAHRTLLNSSIERLGDLVHQVVAISSIYLERTKAGQDLTPWRAKGDGVASELLEARRSVRYPLWGIDDGLRTLARLPNWITNYGGRPREGEQLLEKAESLRKAVDTAIRKSYLKGRPPTWRDRRRIAKAVDEMRTAWTGPRPPKEQRAADAQLTVFEDAGGNGPAS
jgi:hypothetical protein